MGFLQCRHRRSASAVCAEERQDVHSCRPKLQLTSHWHGLRFLLQGMLPACEYAHCFAKAITFFGLPPFECSYSQCLLNCAKIGLRCTAAWSQREILHLAILLCLACFHPLESGLLPPPYGVKS